MMGSLSIWHWLIVAPVVAQPGGKGRLRVKRAASEKPAKTRGTRSARPNLRAITLEIKKADGKTTATCVGLGLSFTSEKRRAAVDGLRSAIIAKINEASALETVLK